MASLLVNKTDIGMYSNYVLLQIVIMSGVVAQGDDVTWCCATFEQASYMTVSMLQGEPKIMS